MVSVLLLPGNMCDARLWEGGEHALLAAIETAGWPVYRPALNESTIPAMASALLEDHCGRLVPIGFSMGGIVALELARRAPDQIVGIGLIATNAGADLPERSAARPRQQAAVRRGDLAKIVVEELKPNYLAAGNRGDADLLDLLRDMALALGPEIFVRQSEALRTRDDLSAVLPELGVPAFIACGAEDLLCPPAWHEALARSARDPELHIVAGAGHMLPLERPRVLADQLGPWLARLKEQHHV